MTYTVRNSSTLSRVCGMILETNDVQPTDWTLAKEVVDSFPEGDYTIVAEKDGPLEDSYFHQCRIVKGESFCETLDDIRSSNALNKSFLSIAEDKMKKLEKQLREAEARYYDLADAVNSCLSAEDAKRVFSCAEDIDTASKPC